MRSPYTANSPLSLGQLGNGTISRNPWTPMGQIQKSCRDPNAHVGSENQSMRDIHRHYRWRDCLRHSPMTKQSCRPNVRHQPMSLPPTLLNKFARASSRGAGVRPSSKPLRASPLRRVIRATEADLAIARPLRGHNINLRSLRRSRA